VTAAGCGAALKEYGHLLKEDPDYAERAEAFAHRVRDVTEYLAERELVDPPVAGRADRHLPGAVPPGARPADHRPATDADGEG
jgi:glycolate oxidase iron-sulfur subunit